MESRSYPIKKLSTQEESMCKRGKQLMWYYPQTCSTAAPRSGTAAPAVSPRLHFTSSCLLNLLHNLTPSPLYNLNKYSSIKNMESYKR